MKNVKMHENFKKLIGGSKLVFAGAGLGATLLMTGCSGCAVEKEPASEVVVETSETPSQIEIIETSEQPSEEISEEPVVEEAELPELPILDENGNVYNPGMFTTEDVYAAIDKMVAENEFENDLERDKAIAFMIYVNSPYISKDTFETIKEDYCANISDTDFRNFCQEYIDDQKTVVPINYLLLDEKQGDVALQIVNYCNSDSCSREEYSEYASNYIEFARENMGYNPINYILYAFENKKSNTCFIKKYLDLDDDEFNTLFFGMKKDTSRTTHQITFGDGKTFLFEADPYLNYGNYHSSHIEKSSGK